MGSPAGEGLDAEHPRHAVRITRPFYLGIYEVTQGQYQAAMGRNPSSFHGSADLPVVLVSWLDAVRFCNTLSERKGLKPFYETDGDNVRVPDWGGSGYRLPTEAEWEYACRAGSTTVFGFGDDQARLGEFAWFLKNSGNRIHPVGERGSNPFGLYDMHGNVWEWCWDRLSGDYYKRSPEDDPPGDVGAPQRVHRGGSLGDQPRDVRSAARYGRSPAVRGFNIGFRLARGQSVR